MESLFKPIFLKSLWRKPNFYTFLFMKFWYRKAARTTTQKIWAYPHWFFVNDILAFYSMYRDIFVYEIYRFPSDKAQPRILDIGSNIGVSVMYFKHLFPGCRITSFEADPKIMALQTENLKLNGIQGVECVNKAVWKNSAGLNFVSDGAFGGYCTETPQEGSQKIPTVGLSELLSEGPIDFLKIDVEGVEYEIIRSAAENLHNVKMAFVEFHSFRKREQHLGDLIQLFENRGFRTHVQPEGIAEYPFFANYENHYGMDMQLNVFFMKKDL